MEKLAADFSDDPERTLPEAGPLESAKSYREKKAKPLWEKIVKVLRSVYRAYFDSRASLSGCRAPMIVRSVRTAPCQPGFMRFVPRGTA